MKWTIPETPTHISYRHFCYFPFRFENKVYWWQYITVYQVYQKFYDGSQWKIYRVDE